MSQQTDQQPYAPAPAPKKKHTALVVVLVILAVLIVGGLVSCAACGAAVTEVAKDNKAESVSSNKSDGSAAIKLFSKNGVTVTATERGEQLGSPYYTIKMKNKSKHNVYVSIDNVSVDGTMVSTFFYEDVAKGKTATAELTLPGIDGMESLKNVEGQVKVTDQDNLSSLGKKNFTIE